MIVRFRPEAEQEFGQALNWYRSQQAGLDIEFIRCVDEAVERIKCHPQMFPPAMGNKYSSKINSPF